jgi:hypothetical protein
LQIAKTNTIGKENSLKNHNKIERKPEEKIVI